MKSKLEAVLRKMTPAQREEFAKLAQTTPGTLRQIAVQRRGASALMAVLIDEAAQKLELSVPRSTLNSGCAVCKYARRCEKKTRGK